MCRHGRFRRTGSNCGSQKGNEPASEPGFCVCCPGGHEPEPQFVGSWSKTRTRFERVFINGYPVSISYVGYKTVSYVGYAV